MATPSTPSDPPSQTAKLSGGQRFTYTDEGEGPAFVMVHGIPGSARDFRWLAAALSGRARVVRLELPGFGGTPVETMPATSFASRGAFVADAVRVLGLPRCVLVGHSMGGGIAAAAALELRERVALVSSVGLRPHRAFRRLKARGLAAAAVDVPLLGTALTLLARRALVGAGFSPRVTLAEVAHTLRCIGGTRFEEHAAHVRQLRAPALLAWAEDDALIEPPIFEELGAALPEGPRLRWAEGGHNVQKSHAVELADALFDLAGLHAEP